MTLPESKKETLTQHSAEVEGSVGTASFDCVGERAESGLLMLFGGGRKRKRKRKMKMKLGARLARGHLDRAALNPGGQIS